MSTPSMILTAHVAAPDIRFFDDLRSRYFPPERNYLSAHLTVFHKLPSEHRPDIEEALKSVAEGTRAITAGVMSVRHLGSGVAYDIHDAALECVRRNLRDRFRPWLGAQDLRPWQPHITVQNKVHWQKADALFDVLSISFSPREIRIEGLDLWTYMQGPWRHEAHFAFCCAPQT